MSLGALKIGEDQYYDIDTFQTLSREWYGEQGIVDLGYFTGHDFPEALRNEVNQIIGDLLADIQDASFVSGKTLNTVHVPENDIPPRFKNYPRGTTLPLHRLASIIYNRSGDVVRQLINRSEDEELKRQAAQIEQNEDDKAISLDGLFFHENFLPISRKEYLANLAHVYKTDVFNNTELLNQEARELLELLGEGVVEAVRDYVGVIARRILDVADTRYDDLYFAARRLPEEIEENGFDEDVDYSTLSPDELVSVLKKTIEIPLLDLVVRLPEDTNRELFKRIYGFDSPDYKE